MNRSVISTVDAWPIVWRVTAPACGSYDHDMVFLETDSEQEAAKHWRALRQAGWPVRLEQVRCGPLPDGYDAGLRMLRKGNAQNPGTIMREIPGAWTRSAAGCAS